MTSIRGAGGKSGGGGGISEQPDTLRSRAYARVVDLISEGEIEGLVDGAKSIYLDGVPVQNADGTYNFTGFAVQTRVGTQGQTYISGFPSVENELAVGVEATFTTSITRSITDTDVDAVRVTIGIPALYRTNDEGEVRGHRVTYVIDVQYNGGGFNEIVRQEIIGKAGSHYQRAHRVELTGAFPVDVRVRRITADESGAVIQNKTFWDSYTEIIDGKLRYPNSAIIAASIDSSQFRNIPTRGYDTKGIKLQVPANYNPLTRVYTGNWNGLFQTAWSDNPAWVFYDILTNDRYGLGLYITDDQVDKWGLYTIAQYCDTLVPNGKGGSEPRFTCNMYMQTRQEAYTVLNNLASIFRGMAFWGAGVINVAQDAPADAVHLFTAANVVDGLFTYSGSGQKARHTVALVRWNDPTDLYRDRVEYTEDLDGIARYGVRQVEVAAVGCTSQGQAARVGKWILYSERYETETCTFRTGLEGAVAAPGDIIKVADPARAGVRLGGRVRSATTTAVTLDAAVTLAGGQTYTLSIVAPDGTVESRTVATLPGSVSVIDPTTAFLAAPLTGSIWILSSDAVTAQLFRVIAVTEPERGQYEFTALKHYADKYTAIEQNLVIQEPDISDLRSVPDTPGNVQITESLYESASEVKTLVSISWDPVDRAREYLLSYKIDNGNVTHETLLDVNEFGIRDAPTGIYTVFIRAVNAAGIRSVASENTKTIFGKTAAPADVAGFALSSINSVALLTWNLHADLDVRVGGKILVKYSSALSGATWVDGVDVAEYPGNAVSGFCPLLIGTYMAKAIDSLGNISSGTASVVTSEADVIQFNFVLDVAEHPTWTGAKSSIVYDSGVNGIKLDGAVNIDSYTDNIDDWDYFDVEGGLAASGYYTFANSVDLGAIYTSRLTAAITALAYDTADLIDSRLNNMDDWADFDGANITDATARIEVRTTTDNPAGAPIWGPWQPFFVGDYKAWGLQFRLFLQRVEDTHQIMVTATTVSVDMPDRVEAAKDIAAPDTGYSVVYAAPFRVIPAIAVTPHSPLTGDYYAITAKTAAGFSVIFRNSGGAGVARTFDWIAKGYGYQQ